MIKTDNYSIFLNDNFANLNSFLNQPKYSKIFVLTDENTQKYCLPILENKIDIFKSLIKIKIQSGEHNKNINTCCYIWKELSDKGADRKSLMINLGGGVIGDMGGFVASTFKRGIDFINIPTTLLSQVDASVGGKLGIDFGNLKNQIGLFANPLSIHTSTEFLKTLPKKQILSGYAEMLKHGLILDADYWLELNNIDIKDLDSYNILIKKSIEIKNNVVTKDPFEKSIRKALNFGHTIGHAIESYSLDNDKEPLLHGECIAIGMVCESYLSFLQTGLSQNELKNITDSIIKIFGKYILNENSYENLLALMSHDKKNENNNINFSLIKNIGNICINQSASKEEIIKSLEYYRNI